MIPKTIHCVWLSGDEKPQIYQDCIKSWKEHMPDFEIQEWSMSNLPPEVLNQPFVSGAIKAKKWAYATDYIRLWALSNYGGIYIDMDVMVFKSFEPFLKHRFFSSIELNPKVLYNNLSSTEIIGIGIEAAIMGSEKNHPFLKDNLDNYQNLQFINTPEFCFNHIMPRMLTRTALRKYGFKHTPSLQVLKEDMWLYPCDVFSSVYNWDTLGVLDFDLAKPILEKCPIRHSLHLCAHAWYEGTQTTTSLKWKFKHMLYKLSLAKYWRKKNNSHSAIL